MTIMKGYSQWYSAVLDAKTNGCHGALTGPTAFAAPTRTQYNAQPPRLHQDCRLTATCLRLRSAEAEPARDLRCKAAPQDRADESQARVCVYTTPWRFPDARRPTAQQWYLTILVRRVLKVGAMVLTVTGNGSLVLCEYSSWVPVPRAPVERVDFVLGLPQKEFRVGDVRFCAESRAGCDRSTMPSVAGAAPRLTFGCAEGAAKGRARGGHTQAAWVRAVEALQLRYEPPLVRRKCVAAPSACAHGESTRQAQRACMLRESGRASASPGHAEYSGTAQRACGSPQWLGAAILNRCDWPSPSIFLTNTVSS